MFSTFPYVADCSRTHCACLSMQPSTRQWPTYEFFPLDKPQFQKPRLALFEEVDHAHLLANRILELFMQIQQREGVVGHFLEKRRIRPERL